MSEAQVSAHHGFDWVPVRRFPVVQSSAGKRKLRPVDDFTECKVNSAFGSADKVDLRALDEFVAACRLWTRAVLEPGLFEVPLSDGQVLQGLVREGWAAAGDQFPVDHRFRLEICFFAVGVGSFVPATGHGLHPRAEYACAGIFRNASPTVRRFRISFTLI